MNDLGLFVAEKLKELGIHHKKITDRADVSPKTFDVFLHSRKSISKDKFKDIMEAFMEVCSSKDTRLPPNVTEPEIIVKISKLVKEISLEQQIVILSILKEFMLAVRRS